MMNYWWSEVTKDVGKYVDGYNMCYRIKNWAETPVQKSMTNEIPEKLWTHLTVDLITNLLLVARKDAIPVVCDRLLKIICFVVTTKETLVEGLVWLFRDNIWKLYRLPENVILDIIPQFVVEFTK